MGGYQTITARHIPSKISSKLRIQITEGKE